MAYYVYIGILAPFIALLCGIFKFRFLDKGFKFLLVFVGFAFFTEAVLNILIRTGFTRQTTPELHFYIQVEFLLLALFYTHQLSGFINKKIQISIIILFELYSLINILIIQGLSIYPNIVRAVEGLILILFSLILFNKIIAELKYENIWKVPLIWVNLAVLIYFSGIFFYNILFNIILNYSREFSKVTHHYFTILNTIFYLFIAFGFLLKGKQYDK